MVHLARSTDDSESTRNGQLDGDRADSARGSLNEHGPAGAQREPVEDAGRRLDVARGTTCFLPAPRGRLGRPGGQYDVIRVGGTCRRRGHSEDFVADRYPGDALA